MRAAVQAANVTRCRRRRGRTGAEVRNCTLIGDSLTDIEAARAAGVRVVGYANKAWKVDAFSAADAVVTSMEDIAVAVSSA